MIANPETNQQLRLLAYILDWESKTCFGLKRLIISEYKLSSSELVDRLNRPAGVLKSKS